MNVKQKGNYFKNSLLYKFLTNKILKKDNIGFLLFFLSLFACCLPYLLFFFKNHFRFLYDNPLYLAGVGVGLLGYLIIAKKNYFKNIIKNKKFIHIMIGCGICFYFYKVMSEFPSFFSSLYVSSNSFFNHTLPTKINEILKFTQTHPWTCGGGFIILIAFSVWVDKN